jgi:hypothetical protein
MRNSKSRQYKHGPSIGHAEPTQSLLEGGYQDQWHGWDDDIKPNATPETEDSIYRSASEDVVDSKDQPHEQTIGPVSEISSFSDVMNLVEKANYSGLEGQKEAKSILLEYAETEPTSDLISIQVESESITWAELQEEVKDMVEEFESHYDSLSDSVENIDKIKQEQLKIFLRHRLPCIDVSESETDELIRL